MSEYIETMKKISGQMWTIFKSNLPVKNDDEYWDNLILVFGRAVREYNDTEFYRYALDMSRLYLDELQRLWRKEFKSED